MDALDPQVLHTMTFKTSMKTSYLVATDAEWAMDKYILLDGLDIYAGCAVFWPYGESKYKRRLNRTVLPGFFIC